MKYLTHILVSSLMFLKTDAFAADTVGPSQEQRITKKRQRALPPAKQSSYDYSPSEIVGRLEVKANVLRKNLPLAMESLDNIRGILKVKANSYKEQDISQAVELARYATSIDMLITSMHNVMNFLSKNAKEDMTSVSLAIIGSGTFKESIDNLTEFLSQSTITKDIDCTILNQVSAKIYTITKDIDNPTFSYGK